MQKDEHWVFPLRSVMMVVTILSSKHSTHSCFQFVIILGQCFGLFPISGITGASHLSLHFKWLSPKVVYTIIFLTGLFIHLCFHLYHVCAVQGTFLRCVPVLFFGFIFLTVISFLRLARMWPEVLQKWTEVDKSMKSYGFPKNLGKNINILSITVILAAVLEHILFVAHGINSLPKDHKTSSIIDTYFESNFDNIFTFVPYNFYIGIVIELIVLYSTFTWNYMDLFIMVISKALSERFKQVSKRLTSLAAAKVKNEAVWMLIREDYNRLNRLCKTIDEAVSSITFLSFTNNLFFIIIQLYNSIELKNSVIGRIYFVYSFAFLIIRTVAVALYAGKIDCESKRPASVLNALPYDIYNVEIDRFLQQIKIDPSSLTGKGFFRVRKSLVLSIAGAIVTYELILIQFNEL